MQSFMIILLYLVLLLAGYPLRGKSSIKLHNLFLINVGPVIIVPDYQTQCFVETQCLMCRRFVHNLYIHGNGLVAGVTAYIT